ncbi:hypothetical protein JKP88DRAFT_280341 [Tribonema minus]|uniref:Uncharacterized protein n=1 Tax=Tribonema minus TaxID=303371 RepID=A0A835YQM9_9STRA|nr:hypothetical protein JKP88DRAFT_280341 [Tribonema minus]
MFVIASLLLAAALTVNAWPGDHVLGQPFCIKLYNDVGDNCYWTGTFQLSGVPSESALRDIISSPFTGVLKLDDGTDTETVYGAVSYSPPTDDFELTLSIIDPFGRIEIDFDDLKIGTSDQAVDGLEQWSLQSDLDTNAANELLCSATIVEC